MSLRDHIFIDNVYLVKNAEPTFAYITLGKKYIHYTISNEDKSQLFFVKSFYKKEGKIGQLEFDELLSDQLLRQSADVHIAIDTHKQVLLPQAFLVAEDLAVYFSDLHEIEQDEEIFKQEIDPEITELYLVKKGTVSYLKNAFKKTKIYSHSACLLKTQLKQQGVAKPQVIYIHTSQDSFQLTYFSKGKLHYYQSFDLTAASDILYCMLNVMQWHQADMKETQVVLTGFAEIQHEIAALLSTYFEVGTFELSSYPAHAFDTEHFPAHILFHQYALISCAS
jgi:hypothetical protein